jgi:hypothetical protein
MTLLDESRRRARTRTRPGQGAAGCERPPAGARGAEPAPTLFTDVGGESTLEALVSGAWEGLAAHHRIACPLCGGEMVAVFGAHARPAAGRCGECGTELS